MRYTEIIERHLIPRIGALLLRDLRPAHIQSAYGEALAPGGRLDGKAGPLSPRTVLQHHRVLKEALSHAVEWQLIAHVGVAVLVGVWRVGVVARILRAVAQDLRAHSLLLSVREAIAIVIKVQAQG